MVKKIYRKLTEEQKERGVIFSSCLSVYSCEIATDTKHEVFNLEKDKQTKVYFDKNQEEIKNLKDDKFFNSSHFKFNIIRT